MKNKITLFMLLTVMAAMHIGAEPAENVSTVDVNSECEDGKTALHKAVQSGDLERVKELLAGGAGIDIQDKRGKTALTEAVGKRDLEIVKELLMHGANPNTYSVEGSMPALVLATCYGTPEMVKVLLEHKADPNIQDSFGQTAMMLAIGWNSNDLEIVKELLAHNADPNIQDKHGYTALAKAIGWIRFAIVKELLMHKADPSIRNEDDILNLHSAAASFSGTEELMELLAYLADSNRKVPKGRPTLSFISFLGLFCRWHIATFSALLKYKLWKKPIKMQIIK